MHLQREGTAFLLLLSRRGAVRIEKGEDDPQQNSEQGRVTSQGTDRVGILPPPPEVEEGLAVAV